MAGSFRIDKYLSIPVYYPRSRINAICNSLSHFGAIDGTQTIGVNQNQKFMKIDTNSFVSLKKHLVLRRLVPGQWQTFAEGKKEQEPSNEFWIDLEIDYQK